MLARAALGGIWLYQRALSPRKGYACAYRVAHGGPGCSGYAKAQIQRVGLLHALSRIRARFSACKLAAESLQQTRSSEPESRKRPDKRSKGERCCSTNHIAGLGCDICGAMPCGGGKRRAGSGLDSDCAGPCDGCDVCSCSF